MSGLYERECAVCHGSQAFYLEYQGAEPDTGLQGGTVATLLMPHEEYPLDWSGEIKCICSFTDAERETLENDVARDYDLGWEPII